MLFSSVASLPFFDHSEIDKVIQDLETENNNDNAESVANITTDDFIVLVSDFRTNPDEWNFKGTRPVVIDFYATWILGRFQKQRESSKRMSF